MRQEIRSKDCSLAGASDLTVVAPIRKGFVPGLGAVTYKTRVQMVLKALHTGRSGLHEFELARMLSDAVERVGRIHSVRIAVLEPHDQVLLAVTFDGAWESYVRVIWQKVARLLDLIFCNTEDYVNGWENSFEAWGAWLRSRQAETSFLYAVPGLTVADTTYLRMLERSTRSAAHLPLAQARLAAPTTEEIAQQLFASGQDPTSLPPSKALDDATEAQPAVFRQGIRSLAGLYRLADLYPPPSPDGQLLLRAAHELLPEFERVANGDQTLDLAWARAAKRFKEPLEWFRQVPPTPRARTYSPPPDTPVLEHADSLQAGILEPYPDVDHGVLVMLGFSSPKAVEALLKAVKPTLRHRQMSLQPGDFACNLAFSLEGLRIAGLTDAEVELLPTEFVQGMERRASVLGDVRINHPRRWRLPMRNWHLGEAAPEPDDLATGERVPLESVHAVLQLRRIRVVQTPAATVAEVRKSLYDELVKLLPMREGVVPLSLQWVHRLHSNGGRGHEILDHFGFQDGSSDPVLNKTQAGTAFSNHVHPGEALWGYPNAADVDPPALPKASPWLRELLHNGSFLVLRKLRQDVAQMERVAADGAAAIGGHVDPTLVKAKMMGRWPHIGVKPADQGKPLVRETGAPNDFNFTTDREGSACPFHSHIRRANPREAPSRPDGARPPRIFRRSLSYGPAHDGSNLDAERGLMFMAYNANLGEQFETVQRWLSGGNSSRGYSGQSDPLLGVPEPGRVRTLHFEHDHAGASQHCVLQLDGDTDLLAEPTPLVRLEWGGYFFTPSQRALDQLQERAAHTATAPPREQFARLLKAGEAAIEALRRIEAAQGREVALREWKAALEDPQAALDFKTTAIWAAIREHHGGVLRTPYGVLVASHDAVDRLLGNADRHLTSTGYLPRMRQSFGAIYLGMDAGQEDGRYELESHACNGAIRALAATAADRLAIHEQARQVVRRKLDEFVTDAQQYAQEDEWYRLVGGAQPPRERLSWEVTFDVRELVDDLLATFCEKWFGLSSRGDFMQRSGFKWNWKPSEPPCYPGHFMAPSRYIFQPHPEKLVEDIGMLHGQAMLDGMVELLKVHGAAITAPVTQAVLGTSPTSTDTLLAARTLVGALMGMVPTVDANLRRVMDRWLSEGALWSLRGSLRGAPAAQLQSAVENAFLRTMQTRVAPDTLWRTAQHSHVLAKDTPHEVDVRPGDILVAGLGSAAQEGVAAGAAPDVSVAFGHSKTSHATHACPGYGPALAMMQGFVAELVATPLSLRPGPAPMTISLGGHIANAAKAQWTPPPPTLKSLRTKGVTVWTFGDSWLSKLPACRSSLAMALRDMGYGVDWHCSARGKTLRSMAAEVQDVCADLRTAASQGSLPDVLLVGGGGNDIVNNEQHRESVLFDLLVEGATTAAAALDATKTHQFVNVTLAGHYRTLLKALLGVKEAKNLPILVHAYAYPIPDGDDPTCHTPPFPPLPLGDAWLGPVFELKRLHDTALNTEVMRLLIKALNEMVARVIDELAEPRLKHLDLRGRLDDRWDAAQTYKQHWEDELHANKAGFKILAGEVDKLLQALAPAGLSTLRAGTTPAAHGHDPERAS
jgi:Dyp-type peroxidase family